MTQIPTSYLVAFVVAVVFVMCYYALAELQVRRAEIVSKFQIACVNAGGSVVSGDQCINTKGRD